MAAPAAPAAWQRRTMTGMLAAALLLALAMPARAQTRPAVRDSGPDAPATLVYLGDSFFAECFQSLGGLGGHVTSLLRAAGSAQQLRAAPVAISGARLEWIGRALPRRVGRAELAVEVREEKPFDLAILADCRRCAEHPPALGAFLEQARRDAATVRRHGGLPVLFMSWAGPDSPDAAAALAEAYTLAGNAAEALVIPAGLAFARAAAARPGIELVAEGHHPSLAGTYLAALVTYAALYGQSPAGNRFTAGLETEEAAFLQAVAWETVWTYYAGQRPPE